MKNEIDELFNTVVKGGYCSGCGACAAVKDSPITMEMDRNLQLQAKYPSNNNNRRITASVLSVCPFSNQSKNEEEIAKNLYRANSFKDEKLGYYKSTFAGYSLDGTFRENGSSGGMGSWILTELLEKKLVNGIIHVKNNLPNENDKRLFKYAISSTREEIINGAETKYYPIELSEVINQIRNRPGRYAVVGIPCFIKAIRLLCQQEQVLNDRIKFCIGLVCGHLKSAHFASMWAWQVGIHPDQLTGFSFRRKLPENGANKYGIAARGLIDGIETERISPPLHTLFGADWGWGLFKYNACDYCDDVVAETADVTVGDAWLPQYVNDSHGTNIIIIRNLQIKQLIEEAAAKKQIHIESLTKDEVISSQNSGFSHRREALSFRLYLKDKQKEWRPHKRVVASANGINYKMRKRQLLRLKFVSESHQAFQEALSQNSFDRFKSLLNPIITEYKKTYPKPNLPKRIKEKLKKILYL